MTRMIVLVAASLVLPACSSKAKENEKKEEPAAPPGVDVKGSGALGSYGNLPVPADFIDASKVEIDASNFREILDVLERDYASE